MEKKPLFAGEALKELIPQRKPMVMIDSYYGGNEEEGESGLTLKTDNIFCENGLLKEPGLIEHIAQTAAGFNGYAQMQKSGNGEPHIGYIGEIKKLEIERLPKVGERLRTQVKLTACVMNVSLMQAEVKSQDETIATCQIKLFEKTE